MADLTVPAGANTVRAGDKTLTKIAQVAIDSGEVVYEDASNGGKFNLADADAEASAKAVGVAINDAAAGEPCTVALPGSLITFGGGAVTGATAGLTYVVSTTAGGIAPVGDLSSGDYVRNILKFATTATAYVVEDTDVFAIP